VGSPGKIIGWVSEAGKRLRFDHDGIAYCEKSKKKYKIENNLVSEI
jgi:UDP-2-acetamido-3-amino-2,3-dideoxy-glucuronate N-acetyltransferase